MSVQMGGGSGNQSGASSSQNDSTSSGATSGTSSQSDSQSATSNSSGATTNVPTDLWSEISQMLGTNIGSGGATPGQQGAINDLNANASAPSVTNGVNYADQILSQYVGGNNPAPTVNAAMQPYLAELQPYINQNISGQTGLLQNQAAQSANQLLAQYGGSGAYGGGGMSTALGNLGAQEGLGVAALAPQLEMQGFQTAEQPATTDVGSNLATQAQSIGAIQDYVGNLMGTNSAQEGNATTALAAGGTPLQQMIAALGSQVPGFGQFTSGSTSGSQTGATTGATTGNMTGTSSGASSGFNTGSSGQSTTGAKI